MSSSSLQVPGGNDPFGRGQSGAEILPVLWRRRFFILTMALVAAIAAYGLSHLQSKRYEATAQMILTDPGTASVFDDSSFFVDPVRHVRTQAELATSRPVLFEAAEMIDWRLSLDELDDAVSVRASRDLDLVTINALDPTPAGAAEIANAIGFAYQSVVNEEVQAKASNAIAELDDARAEIQARVNELEIAIEADPDNVALRSERDAAVSEAVGLEGRARQIAVDAALYGSGVQLFEAAKLPEDPARPLPLRNALLGGFLGLILAGGYAWWRSQSTLSAEQRHDPAPILGAPLLGVVPDLGAMKVTGRAPALTAPDSAAAEAYNFIAASLMHAVGDRRHAVVLVTSPGEGDGKTLTTVNAAVAVARGGRNVVIVDGDARVRGMTRWFGGIDNAGLSDMGHGRRYEDCSSLHVGWAGAAFSVVPSGSPIENTAGFFRSIYFERAITALRDRGGVIMIDSPPTLAVSDAVAMAPHSDGVVLVIKQGTQLKAIEDARDRIASSGTPILGYVFNRATNGAANPYGYRYEYGVYPANGQASSNGHSAARRPAGSGRS